MSNNVVDANNDVNDNMLRYATGAVSARPYHHGDLRRALLAQAESTVREHGVERLSLRELARQVGVSHAQEGFARLGAELREAVAGAGEDFQARLRATAAAYIRFATHDAALLELMFAGKHREHAESLDEAADRAFSVMLELILQGQASGVLEPGEPKRVGLVLFATMQGIAALVTGGMVGEEQLDELVADAIAHFLRGSLATVTPREHPQVAG